MKQRTTKHASILKVGAIALPAVMAIGCKDIDTECFPFDPMGPTKSEKNAMQIRDSEARKILDKALHEPICKNEAGRLFYVPNANPKLEITHDQETTAQIKYAEISTGHVIVSGDVWITIVKGTDAFSRPAISFRVTYSKQGYFLGSPLWPTAMEKTISEIADPCPKE